MFSQVPSVPGKLWDSWPEVRGVSSRSPPTHSGLILRSPSVPSRGVACWDGSLTCSLGRSSDSSVWGAVWLAPPCTDQSDTPCLLAVALAMPSARAPLLLGLIVARPVPRAACPHLLLWPTFSAFTTTRLFLLICVVCQLIHVLIVCGPDCNGSLRLVPEQQVVGAQGRCAVGGQNRSIL